MTALYVETPAARLRLEQEHLLVSLPAGEGISPARNEVEWRTHRFSQAELERVTICESAQITSRAVGALLRAGIPLHFIDSHGRLLGTCAGPSSCDGALRLQQYRRTLDPEFCLGIARRLVGAKILNQVRLLQRLEANRPGHVGEEATRSLQAAAHSADGATSAAELLGVEGAATRRYFAEWANFLPPEFPFEARSTRPPLNPPNATLSFVSAVLYNLLTGLIERRGLDPALGVFHTTDNRRYALALDLIEPLRPGVIEPFVIRLFCHRLLDATDFEPADGGIHLNRSGRATLLFHWEKRLRRLFHPVGSETRSSMLQEIETRIVNYKRALVNPEEFAPFRMP